MPFKWINPFFMRRCALLFLLILPLFFSCVNTRKATYFTNLKDSTLFNEVVVPEYLIQPNDVLSIMVSSIDPEASEMFNVPNQSQVRSSTPTGDILEPAGYLVDKNGFIRLLMVGNIKAAGITKEQLQENIRRLILEKQLLKDPVVEIRHLNHKVTILGEVARPTVITVPTEKITLLEALGLAGDMTVFANRSNVLVIRSDGGQRVANRVDMNSNELFNSPYFFLKPNDVVYVEPNKARVFGASRWSQLLPAFISAISASFIIFDRLLR